MYFEGVRGVDFRGDIAIDDITFKDCSVIATTSPPATQPPTTSPPTDPSGKSIFAVIYILIPFRALFDFPKNQTTAVPVKANTKYQEKKT